MMNIQELAATAREASIALAAAGHDVKNGALAAVAEALEQRADEIFAANQEDLQLAAQEGLAEPLLKRLGFDRHKLNDVISGIRSLMALPDPVGRQLDHTELDTGLDLYRVTCPIGVIGVIFESRPDALVQISSLCLKSGNAVLLKGGREALRTNRVLADIIQKATVATCPAGWLALLETREDVNEMLKLDQWIDLIIPRGSNAFVKYIMEHSRIPVMGHADGICHVFVDKAADLDMAVAVCCDSKCQYVSVCNAMETLLIHEAVAAPFLQKVVPALRERKVRLLGCEATRRIIPDMEAATEADWDTEYLDRILSIRIVPSLDAAIDHINCHGSGHTDAIVTADEARAERFMNRVDSGDVFWNCSTRFADGFRFGLGAEVGISTNKLHARGPVGLEGLTIYKWKLKGHGQIVADYAEGRKHFTHRKL